MTNRITSLFENKENGVLNVYFTAGFPNLEDTIKVAKQLQASGADMIEIGMPFSDPLADGPTIQRSSEIALENGMTMKTLFSQLENMRSEIEIPVILMGYINPVIKYGVEAFCEKAASVGVDGIILPDLPFVEYEEIYKPIFNKYNLSNIFLVTPQTSDERLKKIDEVSEGFIYVVSTSSTTGNEAADIQSQVAYFERIKNAGLSNPTLIGFNIKDHQTFTRACDYANGAIIGSAFIKAITDQTDLNKAIQNYIGEVKGA